MKAKVIKPFRGRRDGSGVVEHFQKGDLIDGDLAVVAVREKWAAEFSEAKEAKIIAATDALAAARQKHSDLVSAIESASADKKAEAEAAASAAKGEVDEAQAALDKLTA